MKTSLLVFFLLMSSSGLTQTHESKILETGTFKLSYQAIKLSQWQETISRYKGNILVVDMWATWCSSCLKRFPHMVEMNKKYADKNVKFISLLLEDPEEPEAIDNAKNFLIKQKADFDHYFMDENIMVSFEKLDLLGIPTVFVFSPEGVLVNRLTGDNPNKQFTELDVEMAINSLLK